MQLESYMVPWDIRIIFPPINSEWCGEFFGSENFWIFWPQRGFRHKLDFENSWFCSRDLCRDDVCCVIPWMCTVLYLQFNVFTHFKLSDEIFFNTSKTPIKRAFFWNQKIQKIMTPKGFSTQNRGWKVINF